MKNRSLTPLVLLNALLALLAVARLPAQEEIDITRNSRGETVKPIPVALSGFTGEVDAVLRFDLFVMGFEFVAPDKAQYLISGANTERVEGRVTDAVSKVSLLARAYSGGKLRAQAHRLADDIVLAITQIKGIAQTKIAFKSGSGRSSEIMHADFDGHNATAITADHTIVAAPCWVPGQRVLYYTSYKLDNPDIFSQDLDTGARRVIARYSGLNTSAAVSPDGHQVAMILSKGGSPDVYVANADGTNLRQLTKTREDESSPCWSPDGKTICFATKIDEHRTLAKVPAAGGALQRVPTSGVSSPSEPDWSPDGKWIVFTAQMGNFEICIIPAAGGEARVVVSGEDPSWAPNSRTVIFARRAGSGRRVLSVLDVPTKRWKDAAQNSGSCSQPSWAR